MFYMFQVVPSPIIRSANNCIYSIWYLSHRYWYLPVAVTVWQIPDAVDTVVCAPDDGCWYYPKHVENFPDKINCVRFDLIGYIYIYKSILTTHGPMKFYVFLSEARFLIWSNTGTYPVSVFFSHYCLANWDNCVHEGRDVEDMNGLYSGLVSFLKQS